MSKKIDHKQEALNLLRAFVQDTVAFFKKLVTHQKRFRAAVLVMLACLLAITACSAVFGQCPGPDCPAPGQEESIAISFDSILRVRTSEGKRTDCYGSGTVVRWGDIRLFLTANHVVGSNPGGVSVLVNGQWVPVREIYRDRKHDVALYTAPEGVPEMELGVPDGLQSGTLLYICGFGGNGKKSATTVYYNKMYLNDVMSCKGAVIQGDSGGPVITPQGIVIGFVFANDGPRKSESLCTHSRRVTAMIDSLLQRADTTTEIGEIELCQYVDQGCFGRNCPTPTPIQQSPLTPGYRQPIPDTIIMRPPTVPVAPAPVATPPVTINVPQDQTVIAGWIGDLSGKVDLHGQRLDATESMVGQAIGQAAEIVRTTNGRLTTLETQSMLDAKEREKLPETMDAVVKANFPFIAAIAAVVVIAAFMIRRFLDKRDGQLDGVVDFQGLRQRRRALVDARDGVIDYEYPEGYSPYDRNYGAASQIAKQAKMEAEIEALKNQLAAKPAVG